MNQETRKALFSMDEFAKLGGGQIAYVREIEAQDAMAQFPGAGKLPPAARLFVLHAADGTPIMIGDDREAVHADAREHALSPLLLH